jgi:cleavage and polyadenylation specificity factor subunit 3
MLQEMFGEDSVPKIFKGEKLYVTVDGKKANIDLLNLVSAILVCVILSMLCDSLCTRLDTCFRRFAVKRMRYSSRLCRQL